MVSYIFPTLCAILFSGVTSFAVTGQEVPNSPCPDVFQYSTQADGNVYGRVTIPYDGSSTLQLGVNASMKGYYTDNSQVKLKIKMNTPGEDLIQRRANSLHYNIYFPFQHAIPKITRIEYNRRGFCTGPPEELIPGSPGVTSLWSGHNYYFQTAPSSSPSESTHPNSVDTAQSIAPSQRHPHITFDSPQQNNKIIECGVTKNLIVPLILGGNEISDGTFPWLTAMFTTTGNGYEYKCTANLISDKHVVTAARCVNFFKIQVVHTEDILFIFGKSNLKHWATSGVITRGASAIHTNPEFDANSGHGDISVITLDKPLQFSTSIAPICLWEGDDNINDVVNKKGTIAGWGADEGAQKAHRYSSSVAKSLDMPVVSQDSCLFSNLSYFQLTSDITFCAGQRDGTGACIGDSGAGFMINRDGKYYLRGLASLVLSNKGKCDLANFMVFSDAAKLTEWIKKVMKK